MKNDENRNEKKFVMSNLRAYPLVQKFIEERKDNWKKIAAFSIETRTNCKRRDK